MPDLIGISHVALTVTDLDRSKGWYSDVLGWQMLYEGEGEGTRFCLGVLPGTNLFFGLRQHAGGSGDRFDEGQTGLDHLAFATPSRAALEGWEAALADRGVEFTPTQDADYGHVLNFRDPDNIALELFAMKGT